MRIKRFAMREWILHQRRLEPKGRRSERMVLHQIVKAKIMVVYPLKVFIPR